MAGILQVSWPSGTKTYQESELPSDWLHLTERLNVPWKWLVPPSQQSSKPESGPAKEGGEEASPQK